VPKMTESLSIVDTGMVIEGKINSTGRLIIKGLVKGEIKGENVIIAKEGTVEADVNVETITIGGNYDGQLEATNIMKILSTGKCSGKVKCKDMVVENGSVLNASVDCSLP